MTIDIKNFYLNTPLACFEYMEIPAKYIPDDIIEAYDLQEKIHEGFVYVEICKSMYGLPHFGKLSKDFLFKVLAKHGYRPEPHTNGLLVHDTNSIQLSLVVDDFGR